MVMGRPSERPNRHRPVLRLATLSQSTYKNKQTRGIRFREADFRRTVLGNDGHGAEPAEVHDGQETVMKEIVSGIHSWAKFSEPHGYDFNGFLVEHPAGNLCIDPVEPSPDDLAGIKRRGVARIVVTNRNHSRAANRIRMETGARTAIHPADAPHTRSQGLEADNALEAGQRVGPFVLIAAAGKSPGELVLHWPERRLLIAGDAVIGSPPGKCGLVREQVMDDPAELRLSVARLLELDFDTILMGDGVSILTGAKERLRELVAGFPR
jgi:glyoxylase-like metal-dependent hydrolase (beta-lactamase superfamily II)